MATPLLPQELPPKVKSLAREDVVRYLQQAERACRLEPAYADLVESFRESVEAMYRIDPL